MTLPVGHEFGGSRVPAEERAGESDAPLHLLPRSGTPDSGRTFASLSAPRLSYRVTVKYLMAKYGAYVLRGGASDRPVLSPNGLGASVGLADDLPL